MLSDTLLHSFASQRSHTHNRGRLHTSRAPHKTDPQTGHSPHRAWVGCLSVDGAGGGAALVCSPRVYILLFISGAS